MLTEPLGTIRFSGSHRHEEHRTVSIGTAPSHSLRTAAVAAALVLAAGLAAGCATAPPAREKTARELFEQGQALAAKENYEEAIDTFKEAARGYRDADLDAEIQVALADAYFAKEDFPAAVEAYGEFLRLHPHNSRSDWAQYRTGLGWQRQMRPVDRSQEAAAQAAAAYEALVRGYPRSPHLAEGRAGLEAARRRLAEHELYVGDFYLRTGSWQAAAGRYRTVLDEYGDLGVVDRALYGLGRAYEGMSEADKAAAQFERLRREFPESRFVKELDNHKG